MASTAAHHRPPGPAVWRGLRRRCPQCGQGALFRGYLKQVDACAVCGEAYGHLRPDDAAPWMTILLVGHIVVASLLMVEQTFEPPAWVDLTVWPALTLGLVLLLLPRCKGVVLALLWAMRAEGSEKP